MGSRFWRPLHWRRTRRPCSPGQPKYRSGCRVNAETKQKKNLVGARCFLTCGLRVDWVWILEVRGDLVLRPAEGSWGGLYCVPRAVTWL